MVSDVAFSKCDSTCVKLKRVTTCMKILHLTADNTKRILKLVGAQKAAEVFNTLNGKLTQYWSVFCHEMLDFFVILSFGPQMKKIAKNFIFVSFKFGDLQKFAKLSQ